MKSGTTPAKNTQTKRKAPEPPKQIPTTPQNLNANKKKPLEPEKKIPRKLDLDLPESQIYNRLVEFDRMVDINFQKRKLEVNEAQRQKSRLTVTLRMCIYNRHSDQDGFYHTEPSHQHSLFHTGSWTLRIEGKVINNPRQPLPPSIANRKFSDFFTKIFVQLDKNLYPQDGEIEWQKFDVYTPSNGFEIKRRGNQETIARIFLYLDVRPNQYKLSPQLSKILNIGMETKAKVIIAFWNYIQTHHLQSLDDKTMITSNPELRDLFGVEKFPFTDLPKLLDQHLAPQDPIEIHYPIKLSGTRRECEKYFEISIPVTEMVTPDLVTKELEGIDEKIDTIVQKVVDLKERRDFMQRFVNNPTEFLNNLAISLVQDTKVASTVKTDEEGERKAKFYYQPYIRDAVQQYLEKDSI